jgi:hypothetical protein
MAGKSALTYGVTISGICFGILCCIGIILLCVLLPLSFNYVRYDEYGILYSVMTREGM